MVFFVRTRFYPGKTAASYETLQRKQNGRNAKGTFSIVQQTFIFFFVLGSNQAKKDVLLF